MLFKVPAIPDILELRKAYLPYEEPHSVKALHEVKEKLDLWIYDDSLRQVYKRFVNHIVKHEPENLFLRAFIPVLVFEQESILRFSELSPPRPGLFHNLLKYLKTREEGINRFLHLKVGNLKDTDFKERRAVLLRLNKVLFYKKRDITFRFLFRFAHTLYPRTYMGVNDFLEHRFKIISINSYLAMLDNLRNSLKAEDLEENPQLLRDIELGVIMTLDNFKPKVNPVLESFGFSVEYELSLKAMLLWGKRKFYEAHEVLEEIWKLKKGDKRAREYLQGVIRLALVYHHLKKKRFESADNVLRLAVRQIEDNEGANTLLGIFNLENALKDIRATIRTERNKIQFYARLGFRE